ncbi:Zinc finger bed domain-containing protein 5 [Biomphalaria glabrata]
MNDNGQNLFKNVAEVMLPLLTIPHSSAHCERIFSLVHRNTTEFRSCLNNETIEALLRPGDSELEDLKSADYKSLQASHSGKK